MSGSSYINHFIQPDSIIPNPANPQAFHRYSYVLNSPVNFNDPTGHEPKGPGSCYGYDPSTGGCANLGLGSNNSGSKDDDLSLEEELENFEEPERVSKDEMQPYFWEMLSPEEHRLITENNNGVPMGFLMYNALDKAQDRFDVLLNSPGDAFRHAYWSALITREYGVDFAKDFTTAHETQYTDNNNDPREQSFMDLHNNQIGITIALANPNSSDAELQELVMGALVDGELYVWDGNEMYYSNQCPMCVLP